MSGIRIARFGGFVNAYLVDEDDGMTLIDTTFGRGAAKAILAQAKRPIVRIVLTHAHQDHVGGLDALAAELPDAEVLISARDAKLMAGDNSPEPGEPAGDKIRGYGADTKPTRTIAPGERVGSLEVVAAPGHTPGQLAFLDTRDRTLFAADAYTTLGGEQRAIAGVEEGELAGRVAGRRDDLERADALARRDRARRLRVRAVAPDLVAGPLAGLG